MKTQNYLFLLVLLSTSCIDIIPTESKKLTKDFYLKWSWEKRKQGIYLSDDISTGGLCLVPETVYEVAFNDEFILAKRYENTKAIIEKRLLKVFDGGLQTNKVYPLNEPSDSIYLAENDFVFQDHKMYYFLSSKDHETRTIPDSLFPNKKKTLYHIIDIRDYDYNGWFERNILFQSGRFEGFEDYEFATEKDFIKKRKELKIPANLVFKKVYKK